MSKKKQKQSADEKVDYPRLSIEKAAKLTEKVTKSYGGIISYKELSRLGGAKGKTQGGTFGSITKSLKLYLLMDRYGLKEMKVTEEGKKFSGLDDEEDKKSFLFNLSRRTPIFNELYERYGQNVPKEITSITDFLVNVKKLEKREAGRLANLYLKNHDYFGKTNLDDFEVVEDEDEKKPVINSVEPEKIDEDLITLLKLKYLFQPPSAKSKESLLNNVLEKFKDSGDAGIKSLVEGIKHSENEEGKKALINALLSSFEKKYPILKISEKKEGKKVEKKEVEGE